ncbi:copper homeostasis protein cutC homolog [Toxorhynchites rutilus septentrionalis]|uniref:copper homeostasis protein cutC homolog n=1 Tax=Toxorhynchites rutilus septentrionalis TaxID=329112 RepID=UPI00247A581B|nr:copper homeostasis protein cutC homolog [Toxorhynchites rutilus septentrionalis]XP_055641254.1 copper homeostasis protein cutC homolog [Toxorhynchites rutilus septentrionalis]
MIPLLEICVDSFESAVAAIRGGADRLELCAALSEGGLTPSVGLLREVKNFIATNHASTVVLYAMIRCRRGSDFCYSSTEMKIMLHDLRLLMENGADGFVFGALTVTGEIDEENCRLIATEALAGQKPVTFHRAYDCTDRNNMRSNLEIIASLGFTTVLSSGFESTAVQALYTVAELVKVANEISLKTGTLLTLMPGSGVSPSNAQEIVKRTNCSAIHASARSTKKVDTGALSMGGSTADGEGLLICDEAIVKEIKAQIRLWKEQ